MQPLGIFLSASFHLSVSPSHTFKPYLFPSERLLPRSFTLTFPVCPSFSMNFIRRLSLSLFFFSSFFFSLSIVTEPASQPYKVLRHHAVTETC